MGIRVFENIRVLRGGHCKIYISYGGKILRKKCLHKEGVLLGMESRWWLSSWHPDIKPFATLNYVVYSVLLQISVHH